MTDESWLREELADAVPPPPSAPDRARAARERARRARRRTALLGAAGVAGVAATVAVIAVLTTGLGDRTGEPSPVDATDRSAPSSPYDVPSCPSGPRPGEEDPLDVPARSGPDEVPAGAVSVRLCQGPGSPIDVPDDALVRDVGAMVTAVNDLAEIPRPEVCTQELGPGYRLVFGYDDGSTFVASGRLYGCHEVVVGSGYRADAQAAWDRFAGLLRDQRADLEPPAVPSASTVECDPLARVTALGRPQDLAVAVLGIDVANGGRDSRRAEIAVDELALLLADMEQNTREGGPFPDCGEPPPFPRIVGLTSWGDRVVIPSDCGIGWFLVDDRAAAVWQPGSEARMLLDRLVTKAR